MGYRYEGEFKNGVFNGQGKETQVDTTEYQGWYINGRRDGKGYSKIPGRIAKFELWKNGLFIKSL